MTPAAAAADRAPSRAVLGPLRLPPFPDGALPPSALTARASRSHVGGRGEGAAWPRVAPGRGCGRRHVRSRPRPLCAPMQRRCLGPPWAPRLGTAASRPLAQGRRRSSPGTTPALPPPPSSRPPPLPPSSAAGRGRGAVFGTDASLTEGFSAPLPRGALRLAVCSVLFVPFVIWTCGGSEQAWVKAPFPVV